MTHDLKTWPEYFHDIFCGEKTFEFRKDDRGFSVGDVLNLKEFIPFNPSADMMISFTGGTYTGIEQRCRVTYILRSVTGISEDYCIMGIELMKPWED